MNHMFRCADLNLLLDVESGALHVLSDEASAVAGLYLDGKSPEEISALLSQIPKEDVFECVSELNELKASGLFMTEPSEEAAIDDGGVIKALCLHAAHDCNLRCGYCFASTGDFEGGRCLMPFEVGKAALDFLIAHSGNRHNLEVDFFGGEPMMNFPVVRRITQYGRELEAKHGKEIHFTMTTNCYDLPEGAIDFCNEQMHNLVLSIDGRRETHDAVRKTEHGKPSYDRVLENAKKLIEKRGEGEYYARGTFTRKNLDFVPDAEALWDEGFAHVSIEPVVLPQNHPLSFREEDLDAVFQSYDRLVQTVLRRKREDKPHHFFHFNRGPFGRAMPEKAPVRLRRGARIHGCDAGRHPLSLPPVRRAKRI